MEAEESERDAALIAFLDSALATTSVFAGQFTDLRAIGWDPSPRLVAWIEEPPPGKMFDEGPFRAACVRALQDLSVPLTEQQLDQLEGCLDKYSIPFLVRRAIVFALAQFGRQERADEMIAQTRLGLKSRDPSARIRAYRQMAEIQYFTRDYKAAADTYKDLVQATEAVAPRSPTLATDYYNCSCSLARAGDVEAAFAMLEKALLKGQELESQLALKLLEVDMDVQSLRERPRFGDLTERFFGKRIPLARPARPASRPASNPTRRENGSPGPASRKGETTLDSAQSTLGG